MNKEMVTCGVVAALVAGMYFLGGERPAEAARVVQRERAKIANPQIFLDLEVAPVHRVERLDRVRNPDDMRRFVDARERDPLARPRIGERLALPDLAAPAFFPDELELLPPPPAPHGSWKLLGALLRARPATFPPELIALAEDASAAAAPNQANGNTATEPVVEVVEGAAPSQAGESDPPFDPPDWAKLGAAEVERLIAAIWPDRWKEGRAAALDEGFDRWLELAPGDVKALVGKGTWLDETLRWDEAYAFFREKLIGSQGEGPHGRDPRALLAYGRFLQHTFLREEGLSFLARAADALTVASIVAADAQAIWVEAARGLCASSRGAKAWATRPAQPLDAAAWAMVVLSAYAAGEGAEMTKAAQAGAAALAGSPGERDPEWIHAHLLAAFLDRSGQVKPRTDSVEALIAHAAELVRLGGESRALGAPALDLGVAAELGAARCYTLAAERAADELTSRTTAPERRETAARLRQSSLDAARDLLLPLRDRLREVAQSGALDTVGAHRGLAWMYLLAGDDQLAEVEAQLGLAIDPSDAWLLYLRGAILLRRGEHRLANEALAALLRSVPDMQDALFLAGAGALLSGEKERAGSLLDRVSIAEERFVQGSYLSGLAELGRDRLDIAEQRFQSVLRLDPLHHSARIGQGLVRYERVRAAGEVEDVQSNFEDIAHRVEAQDLRDPLLRYLRDLVTQLDRARNAREFRDALDREGGGLALYEWEPAVEAEGVRAVLQQWKSNETVEKPNAYGAEPRGSHLRIQGRFKERGGRTTFFTQKLIERPIDFLSLEADLLVPASNKARVGVVVGRMPLDATKGPDLENPSFLFGVSSLVDDATDQRTTQYVKSAGGQGQEWISDNAFLEKPFDWPADQPVRVRIEARHYRGQSGQVAEVRITVGGASVHPSEEWIEMRPLQEQSAGSGGFKLVFFAQGDADRPAELGVDNIRIQYRDN